MQRSSKDRAAVLREPECLKRPNGRLRRREQPDHSEPAMTTLNNHVPLDKFYILERKGPSRPTVENLAASIQGALSGLQVDAEKLRGKRLAVTVGSRGI